VEHVNEIVLVGRLSGEPEWRALPDEREVAVWRLIVEHRGARSPQGAIDTIRCVSYDPAVQSGVRGWSHGDVIQVQGALRHRFWRRARRAHAACTRSRPPPRPCACTPFPHRPTGHRRTPQAAGWEVSLGEGEIIGRGRANPRGRPTGRGGAAPRRPGTRSRCRNRSSSSQRAAGGGGVRGEAVLEGGGGVRGFPGRWRGVRGDSMLGVRADADLDGAAHLSHLSQPVSPVSACLTCLTCLARLRGRLRRLRLPRGRGRMVAAPPPPRRRHE
jgi:single-strand DNA-binding protein